MINPFYVEVESSTRNKPVGVGTKSKTGYLTTRVYQRETGCITMPYEIRQHTMVVDDNQYLITEILYQGDVIHQHITNY